MIKIIEYATVKEFFSLSCSYSKIACSDNNGQVENSETSEMSQTSEIFPRLFLFWLFDFEKSKTWRKKTRKKNSEVSEVSDVSEFSFCHFL